MFIKEETKGRDERRGEEEGITEEKIKDTKRRA